MHGIIKAVSAASAALAAATAAPSYAAILIDSNSLNDAIVFNYSGYVNGGLVSGLTGQGTFTLTSIVGSTFNFNYSIENTSGSPITGSRISGFGFDISPNHTSASGSAPFSVAASGNLPGHGNIDVCFKAGGGAANCAGGGGGGVTQGNTSAGTFSLTFVPGTTGFNIEDAFVRYQSINSAQLGLRDGSGIGFGSVPAVPEPATWLMMIAGFGMVGAALRRRQRATVRYGVA